MDSVPLPTFDLDTLKFNEQGLIPAIAQDETGAVLMQAWMNREAVERTIETKQGWYWSRSRQEYWRKGATSGHTQTVLRMVTDCDRDCILLTVDQEGNACHTGVRSCFFEEIIT